MRLYDELAPALPLLDMVVNLTGTLIILAVILSAVCKVKYGFVPLDKNDFKVVDEMRRRRKTGPAR